MKATNQKGWDSPWASKKRNNTCHVKLEPSLLKTEPNQISRYREFGCLTRSHAYNLRLVGYCRNDVRHSNSSLFSLDVNQAQQTFLIKRNPHLLVIEFIIIFFGRKSSPTNLSYKAKPLPLGNRKWRIVFQWTAVERTPRSQCWAGEGGGGRRRSVRHFLICTVYLFLNERLKIVLTRYSSSNLAGH